MRIPALLLLALFPLTALGISFEDEFLSEITRRYGIEASQRLQDWEQLSATAHGQPEAQQITRVNRFFNQIPFISDLEHWGTEDYWATPVEALSTFAADCEDYSVAKYLTLRSLGVPDDKLRITYVKALELDQAHMVLAYYPTPDADPLILDNLINDIRPASQRPDLLPVYSFNGEGLWLTQLQRQDEQRLGGPERLESWSELRERIRVR